MAQELGQKIYPEASSAIAVLLGLGGENLQEPGVSPQAIHTQPAPVSLPVVESTAVTVDKTVEEKPLQNLESRLQPALVESAKSSTGPASAPNLPGASEVGERVTDSELEADALAARGQSGGLGRRKVFRALKFVVPYVVIFVIGVFVYYYFLGNYSFTNFFTFKSKNVPVADAKQKAQELSQYEKAHLQEYYAWINQFYFEVSDASILEPDKDNSANGLSNFQKFLLGLNPKAYDTLGTGLPDGQALTQGLDPLTLKPLVPKRVEILDKFVDLEVVNNRLAAASFQQGQNLRGRGSQPAGGGAASVPASDAAATSLFGGSVNIASGQNPPASQNVAGASIYVAPRTGANLFGQVAGDSLYSQNSLPKEENRLNIDKSKPGTLEISSLKINVPVIWTRDTNEFLEDLGKGVVHYPGTPLPGDVGTAYISGHSSNFAWAKGSYKKVFSALGDLQNGESFTISVFDSAGAKLRLNYVVIRRAEFSPNDQAQFLSTGESIVALSTCWPVGTTAKRLVVFARLSQVEK